MALEGSLFAGAFVLSIGCYALLMICLSRSRKQRKNKLFDASTHLIRAGEAFADASSVLLREQRLDQEPYGVVEQDGSVEPTASLGGTEEKYRIISENLSRSGATLQKTGCALIQKEKFPEENEDFHIDFADLEDGETVQILGRFTEVVQLLCIASDALSYAGRVLREAGENIAREDVDSDEDIDAPGMKILEKLRKTIEHVGAILQSSDGMDHSSVSEAGKKLKGISRLLQNDLLPGYETNEESESYCTKIKSAFRKFIQEIPFMLFSVYRIVFRQSVEEVTLPGPGKSTRREFLFGGYGIPKRPWRVHAYYLAMLMVVANWFFVMFFDSAFYRKSTTCNDLNVRRDAYLCFDISKSILAGPTNCTDPAIRDDLDIYVLCYLEFFNFPIALSLAFSFSQLMIILIHISFALTLWCVKNFTPIAAIVIHVILCVLYLMFFLVYGPIVGLNVNDVKFQGINIFYGDRVLRMVMVFLGFITIVLLTILSPYYWLIDKYHREYRPTYGHEGKKDV